jgi:hypothetical protein
MFAPVVVVLVIAYGLDVTVRDAVQPAGYATLWSCQRRLAVIEADIRNLPTTIEIRSARCDRK